MSSVIKYYVYIFTALLIISGVLTILFGTLYGGNHLYGCYTDSNINLCPNWYEKNVGYLKFKDTTAYIYDNCNCNTCINSASCNCGDLQCYLIGEYDTNTQCKITYNYELVNTNSDTSYESLWSYNVLNTTYIIGEYNNYYVNDDKFSGYCMPVSDVENIGKRIYKMFIGSIVSGSICGIFILIFFICIN